MKETYIKPCMITESFMPNQAVSTCTVEGGIEWTFDCMKGPNTDTENVVAVIPNVSGTCTRQAGYANGINTAWSFGTSRHSNNASGKWGSGNYTAGSDSNYSGDYISVTYSGAQGLLYADSNGSKQSLDTSAWSTDKIDGVVAHSKNGGGTHRMVAPVVDSRTINASW